MACDIEDADLVAGKPHLQPRIVAPGDHLALHERVQVSQERGIERVPNAGARNARRQHRPLLILERAILPPRRDR